MRIFALILATLPVTVTAETFTLPSAPTAATVYPDFAMVSRVVSIEVGSGTHDLILADLPKWVEANSLRVAVSGAQLTATRLRTDALPPQPDPDSAQVLAAKERIEQAKRALRDLDDAKQDASLAKTAATARLKFLSDLGNSRTLPPEPDALAELAQMIQTQTLIATQAQIDAQRAARTVEEGRPELTQALKNAQDALTALTPPAKAQSLLSLSVDVAEAGEVEVSLQYPVKASWVPTYDIFLQRGNTNSLTLRRAARVSQNSGENWQAVELTLATLSPSGKLRPSELYPRRIQFQDKQAAQAIRRSLSADFAAADAPAPALKTESSPVAQFDGIGVRYPVPKPVTLAHSAEAARIPLDALAFDARVFARAVPASDTTAFLMAEGTNSSKEPLLAAPIAQLFVDGALVGQTHFESVPAGGAIVQAFGPLEDIRLTRSVLDLSEGDRGFINRSNAQVQEVLMTIENLGAQAWDVEVLDTVPYSEQDDLIVELGSTPSIDVQNVDDRRGLMQWNLALDAGATQEIKVEQTIRWPEGKILR